MATVDYIRHKGQGKPGALKGVIQYVMQDYKTMFDGQQFVSGIGDCNPRFAFEEMMEVKSRGNNLGGRQFYHIYQSFHPDENVTPQQAHEIAKQLGEYFKGYQVLVATHVDAEHIHSHLLINSVSYETGAKWHSDKHELERLRRLSDELCRQQNLSVLPEYDATTFSPKLGAREYRSALHGGSWKFTLIRAIDDALLRSSNRDEFVQNMEYEGILVKWTPSRKNITYTMPDGKKCRDDKLHDPQYLKANLELLFEQRERDGFVPFTPEPEGGWIAEREQPENHLPTGDLAHDVLRLGRDLERIPQTHKPTQMVGHEDHRIRQREKIKQLAAGHQLRDELDEEQ